MKQNMLTHKLSRGLHLLAIAALLAGLTLAIAPVPVAHAATTRTITVSNAADGASGGTSCTLRDAISAANSGATGTFNGCTISSSGSGTPIAYVLNLPSYPYTLTGAAGEDGNATGDLDILANITINGTGQDTTIIDGNQLDRVLHITSTTTVVINDVTITNGKTPDGTDGTGSNDGGDSDDGGGIYNKGALNIANSIVSGNSTGKGGDGGSGGGNGGNCGSGGGIYNKGTLNVANSTLSGNSTGKGGDGGSASGGGSSGGDGGSGGGIYNSGTLRLTNSTLSGNITGSGGEAAGGRAGGSGGSGGGIYNDGGTVELTNSTVSGNETGTGGDGGRYHASGGNGGNGGDGGGIYNTGVTVELTNSTVSSNRTGNGGEGRDGGLEGGHGGNGGSGGGIYNTSGTVELTNSTVSGNSTGDGSDGGDASNGDGGDGGNGGSGGGIYNTGGTVGLTNSTVSGNITDTGGNGGSGSTTDGLDGSGGDGGGIRRDAGTTNLKNTILAGNSAASSGPDCSGTLTSQDYNLLGDNSNCDFAPDTNDQVGTAANPIDPQLAYLALNPPGNTETHALLLHPIGLENPARDQIPNGTNGCGTTITTDQRGVTRPQGDECDIGAYEVGRGTIVIEKQAGCCGVTGTFTFVMPNLPPSTYPVTEDGPAPGFDLAAITCDDGDSATPSTWDVGTRTATFGLDPGETVKCTFTNAYVPPVVVGGVILPVDRLELLALWLRPSTLLRASSGRALWLGLTALAALATLTVALVRKRRNA